MAQIKVMLVLIELIDQSEREKKNSKIHVQTSLYMVCFLLLCFLCVWTNKRLSKQIMLCWWHHNTNV